MIAIYCFGAMYVALSFLLGGAIASAAVCCIQRTRNGKCGSMGIMRKKIDLIAARADMFCLPWIYSPSLDISSYAESADIAVKPFCGKAS